MKASEEECSFGSGEGGERGGTGESACVSSGGDGGENVSSATSEREPSVLVFHQCGLQGRSS